jgi:hypothetical protein
VRVPQEFSCDDFVALQAEYGFPGDLLETDSESKRARDRAGLLTVTK